MQTSETSCISELKGLYETLDKAQNSIDMKFWGNYTCLHYFNEHNSNTTNQNYNL